MTRIKARYGPDGYCVVSVGHAGTSESCTAVSAILWALAGWVENNVGAYRMEKGGALICIPKCGGAAAVMDMAVIGLQQLARKRPDDVKIEIIWEERPI